MNLYPSQYRRVAFVIVLGALCLAFPALCTAVEGKPRLLVLTDISNEPDDEESLVRLLVYSNEFDIEGLTATTSTWLRSGTREDLIHRDIAAYAKVRSNLLKHAPGFPEPDQLEKVTFTGQPGYGMALVGDGKQSPGSKHLVDVIDSSDPRPLWVTVWSGANTLAQALWDLRASRNESDLKGAVAKLRVYAISDQDDAGPWIRKEFPDLFYIVSPSTQDSLEYWRATWTGISGDRYYKNGPRRWFELVDNPWLEEHVIKNHGPLGALYPRFSYIMEGDTPSFLGLVQNGLGWEVSPGYGGWGGRYVFYRPSGENRAIWTNNAESRDTVVVGDGSNVTSDPATIWRWREHYQHDFEARMNWCIADSFGKANHNPRPALNHDLTKNVLTLKAKSGTRVSLSAEGTTDPDGDSVRVTWWIYPEAGTIRNATLTVAEGLQTVVKLPVITEPGTVHVILQAEDSGEPHLFAYRRTVIEVAP
jgi:hypothetical protein